MKRSRIILGVTTAILAIAGVAASNANRIPKLSVFTYTKISAGAPLCTIVLNTSCTLNGTQGACVYRKGTLQFPVYTHITAANRCVNIAKYNQQ
ncbi:hypothetical protein ACX0G9_27080 [Flavitalea flava]